MCCYVDFLFGLHTMVITRRSYMCMWTQWRKPGAEFGGTENFFADQDDVFFLKKIPFLRQKFLRTLSLSHRPDFPNFPSLLPDFPDLYFVRYRTQPFPHKKNTYFLLFSYFRAHPTTLLLKILGGRMHGMSTPPQTLGGPSPQSPPRFSPLTLCPIKTHQNTFQKSSIKLSQL